jgi:hypothetical protein
MLTLSDIIQLAHMYVANALFATSNTSTLNEFTAGLNVLLATKKNIFYSILAEIPGVARDSR